MLFRSRNIMYLWLLLGALLSLALVAIIALIQPYRLTENDRTDAVREVIAWIMQGKTIPGFEEPYPDSRWIPMAKRFIIVCDSIPMNIQLTGDSRVQRVSKADIESIFKVHDFEKTFYVVVEPMGDDTYATSLKVSIAFGLVGGHECHFTFRKRLWGLTAEGKLVSVS